MKYNNNKQAYNVVSRFSLRLSNDLDVDYCRVRFSSTNHVQNVLAVKERVGDFFDESLPNEANSDFFGNIVEEHQSSMNNKNKEDVEDNDTPLSNEKEVKTVKYLAINSTGSEMTVNEEDLEKFCQDNKLDLESVKAIIRGEQKTHRKWRFSVL
ncbi:hypothetical protein [Bacillus pumilus]|uniref:hypothetical protein n=1 Tax=Bacillus pumilus TaxID=1408 RepID=UPI0011A6F0A6|nr:hypothetical protein [Bacillus pumilus]